MLQFAIRTTAGLLALTLLIFSMGAGYIGSFTALALSVAGFEVIVIDNLYNSSVPHNCIELVCGKRPIFYKADVTD